MFYQQEHPEIMSDEVWITNANERTARYIGWQTKRRGLVAYTAHGARQQEVFPVFAKWEEVERAGALDLVLSNTRSVENVTDAEARFVACAKLCATLGLDENVSEILSSKVSKQKGTFTTETVLQLWYETTP